MVLQLFFGVIKVLYRTTAVQKEKRLLDSCDQLCYYLCPQELEDALMPTLACAAAKIGDIEALEALREMVRY